MSTKHYFIVAAAFSGLLITSSGSMADGRGSNYGNVCDAETCEFTDVEQNIQQNIDARTFYNCNYGSCSTQTWGSESVDTEESFRKTHIERRR